jgi:hypothetical protein
MYDKFTDTVLKTLKVQDKPWLVDLYLPGIRCHINKNDSIETTVARFKDHADKNRDKPNPWPGK